MFKKILLKFSGEALAGKSELVIDPQIINRLILEVGSLVTSGIQVGIVIGGGNLFRGQDHSSLGISRITADHMGMLGTVINALALRDAFENAGFQCIVMSAFQMLGITDTYDRRKALKKLQKGTIVIFAGGTGNPLLTTDSAASLRAIEIGADVLIKATNVDGVYDRDPNKYSDAKLYQKLSFQEALERELGIMDLAAFCQCRDHNMKIVVFNCNKPGLLQKIVKGEVEGTVVE
jgi:uridylate kinase